MTASGHIFFRACAVALALGLGACAKGASTLDDTANGTAGNGAAATGCGNGKVDVGSSEQCDGSDLQGQNCQSMGQFSGGQLLCSAMCTFDTQMCTGAGVNGTGGAGH